MSQVGAHRQRRSDELREEGAEEHDRERVRQGGDERLLEQHPSVACERCVMWLLVLPMVRLNTLRLHRQSLCPLNHLSRNIGQSLAIWQKAWGFVESLSITSKCSSWRKNASSHGCVPRAKEPSPDAQYARSHARDPQHTPPHTNPRTPTYEHRAQRTPALHCVHVGMIHGSAGHVQPSPAAPGLRTTAATDAPPV